jgi:hypothetical protein
MKSIKFIMALMLCSTLFISCSNNDSDEEMQTLLELQEIAEEGDSGENPPPPPTDPDL